MENMRWIDWFQEVCSICDQTLGMSPLDLPDVNWHLMKDDGLTPLEAVREAMDEWGADFGTDIGLLLR